MSKQHDPPHNHIGQTLRKLREDQDLSREFVSDASEITPRHLAAIELGERMASVNTLYRLIRVIGTSADRIFFPEIYEGNTELGELMHLIATCTPKQKKLIVEFVKMLREKTDF